MQHDQDRIARGRRCAGPAAVAFAAFAAWLALVPAARAEDAAGAPAPALADDAVVAQRGDAKLTASQVRDLIRFADPEQRRLLETNSAALLQAVRDRLIRVALMKEAEAKQWDKREDVAFRAELARQDAIVTAWIVSQVAADPNFPTDDQVKAAFEANKGKIMVPRQFHVAQIFLAVPPGASKQTEEDTQRKLLDLRQQILKPKGDFAVQAKRFSDEKVSAVNGGDLGWVREDAMVPQIRTVVQAQAEGTVSDPVRSPNGWHLIKLLAVRPAAPATFAEARDTLVRAMRQERLVEGQRAYLADLLKQQPIQMNEIELSKFAPK